MSSATFVLVIIGGVTLIVVGLGGFIATSRDSVGSCYSSSALFLSFMCLLGGIGCICMANHVEESTLPVVQVVRIADTYQATTYTGDTYDIVNTESVNSDKYSVRLSTSRGLFGQVLGEEAVLLIPTEAEVIYEERTGIE